MTKTISAISYWCAPRLLKILYSSMILLLWLCGLYLCCSVDQEDNRLKTLLMSIIIPLMIITILTFPFIVYMGGCVASLPDACKDVFPPIACCANSKCGAEMEEENAEDPTYIHFNESEEEREEERLIKSSLIG